jgi:hypothetical protein
MTETECVLRLTVWNEKKGVQFMNIKTIAGAAVVVLLIAVGIFFGIRRQRSMTAKTSGTIVDTRTEYDERDVGSGKNRRTRLEKSYTVVYRYAVNGIELREDFSLSDGIEKYNAGASGSVCYDPADPQTSSFSLSDVSCG